MVFCQWPCEQQSYLLLASPVHLIAVVDVPEGYKLYSSYKPDSSFITQEDASPVFSADTFVMNSSVSDSSLAGGNLLVLFFRERGKKMHICFCSPLVLQCN